MVKLSGIFKKPRLCNKLFDPPIEFIIITKDVTGKSAQDSFTIKVKLNFEYVMIRIIAYGSILISLFSLILYRHIFYGIFCKKYYQ